VPRSRVSAAALGSTTLAAVCAAIYLGQVPACGDGGIPDAADVWAWATIAFAAGGMIGSLACLGQRRWITAVVTFALSAGALMLAALSGLC
jgi:hypothetical protein